MPSGDYLVWIDLEMTGLKPDSDAIIEIATVVTDRDLDHHRRRAGARDPSDRGSAGAHG